MTQRQPNPTTYLYTGAFDQAAFQKAYIEHFNGVDKFNLASMPDLLFVLGKIGADARIIDIRWAAYMLATVFIESSHTVKIQKQIVSKKGRVKSHRIKVWRNFAPVDEAGHGKGLRYYLPVKVARLPNGDAQITEYDGDQWVVSAASGRARDLHKHQHRGVNVGDLASELYDSDEGDEQLYYGRGYVQLTWWSNYAAAGVALGRGLALLFDPERVNDQDTAYQILATGMYTGGIFANRWQLSSFFHGGHTDYVGARNMVNPKAKHAKKIEVAKIAERFEAVLLACKLTAGMTSR